MPNAVSKQAPAERVIQVPLDSLVRVEYVRRAIVDAIPVVTRAAVMATRLANLHVCRLLAEGGAGGSDLFCGRNLPDFMRECFRTVCPRGIDLPGEGAPAQLAVTLETFKKVIHRVPLKVTERRNFENTMLRSLSDQLTASTKTALGRNIFRRARSCVVATVHTVVRSEAAGDAAEALRATVNEEIFRRMPSRRRQEQFAGVDQLLTQFLEKLRSRLERRDGEDRVPADLLAEDEMGALRTFLEELFQVVPERLDTKKR